MNSTRNTKTFLHPYIFCAPPFYHNFSSFSCKVACFASCFCYAAAPFQNGPRHHSHTIESFCWRMIKRTARSLGVKRDNLLLFFQQKTPLNWAGLCRYDTPMYLGPVATADTGRKLERTNKLQHHSFKSYKNSCGGCCVSPSN